MTKFAVTEELSTLIRTMRVQTKVTSKELAQHINKSISYISRLENGGIKMIQEPELTQILDKITEGENFFSDKLPAIIQALTAFMSPEKIPQQVWLLYYDGFARPIDIPEAMIAELNHRMEKCGMTVTMLAETVNFDLDFSPDKSGDFNTIEEYMFRGKQMLLLRVALDKDQVCDILNGMCRISNFCNINSIVTGVLRFEMYGNNFMNDEAREKLQTEADWFLEQYGIVSLIASQRLISPVSILKGSQSARDEFAVFHSENMEQIFMSFQDAAAFDMMKAGRAVETLRENLSWDPAFMMRILSIPYYKLDNISVHLKRRLLEEMEGRLEKYEDLPDSLRKFEDY